MTGTRSHLMLVQATEGEVARKNRAERERALLGALLEADDPAAVDAALRALYAWLLPEQYLSRVPKG